MNVTEQMLLIKSLDNGAHVELSEYTGKWFVSARVEISDGVIVSGITEHRADPAAAVEAFLIAVCNVNYAAKLDSVLVTRKGSERREWRWNGAAFTEVTGSAQMLYENKMREQGRSTAGTIV